MIDTVKLRFPIELTPEQLMEWPDHFTHQHWRIIMHKHSTSLVHDGTSVRATYYPPNVYYRKPSLQVEFSMTKILYGENVSEITDAAEIQAAALVANGVVASIPGMPTVDMREGVLQRIDVCHNHQVGELVQNYIKAMSDLEYPHRKTEPYYHEGVQFRSGVATTKFYDKHRECKRPDAKGILRQETTLRKPSYIGRKLGIPNPTLADVSIEWAASILEDDLQSLHINQQAICNRDEAMQRLVEAYGKRKGTSLYGYLAMRQSYKPEQLDYSRRTILHKDKEITDAGVAIAMLDTPVPLPPLQICTLEQKRDVREEECRNIAQSIK